MAPCRISPIRPGAVVTASYAASIIGFVIHQPVAGVPFGVDAQPPLLFRPLQWLPLGPCGLQSGKRQPLRHERQPVSAPATTPVFEVDNIAACLTGKQSHLIL